MKFGLVGAQLEGPTSVPLCGVKVFLSEVGLGEIAPAVGGLRVDGYSFLEHEGCRLDFTFF